MNLKVLLHSASRVEGSNRLSLFVKSYEQLERFLTDVDREREIEAIIVYTKRQPDDEPEDQNA